jgi:quinol monooxygenase YgiN
MYAVVVHIDLDPARAEEAVMALHQAVVPMAKQATGFVGGYWMRSDDDRAGVSVEVFDTKANADAFAAGAVTPPGSPATISQVDVMEVMATA